MRYDPRKRPVSLERAWQTYRDLVAQPMTERDTITTKRAFMMGAATIWYGLFMGLDNATGEPTNADMHLMNSISDEMDKFSKRIDAEIIAEQGGMQ